MKRRVQTDAAPAAIGPYSQAIAAGGMLFVSGQIPLDPESMKLVSDEVEAQTEQVMRNLHGVLQAAGADWDDVVRTTIFLTSMEDFGRVNAIYAKVFGDTPPARACVEVSRLPRDVRVEIDAIALLPTGASS